MFYDEGNALDTYRIHTTLIGRHNFCFVCQETPQDPFKGTDSSCSYLFLATAWL